MSRRHLLGSAGAIALAGTTYKADAASAVAQSRRDRPNIVLFLIDDMGFSDLACFGGEIPTPNIDALAAGGLRFTQFYNAARCSCSRASLLTGTYPHQAGLGHLEAIAVPGSRGLHGKLSDKVVTIAEVLRPAGYATAMAGKWHLGISRGVKPWDRGFDHSLTSPIGEIYYPDQVQKAAQTLFIDGREVPASSPEVGTGHWYSSDMFVDWSARYAERARAAGKPFFLYVPFVGVHFPVMAPPDQVERFRGIYRKNWEDLRSARLARQKELGIVDPHEKLPDALPGSYDWNKLSPEDQDRFDKIMAVYAAAVVGIDKAVGTMVQHLKKLGQYEDTLILLLSDNGGNAESGPDGRLNDQPLGGPRSNTFVGMNWATLQNTPFQFFKHFTHEGGIATPLIAHWSKGITAERRGGFVRTPCHLVDVMATVVDVTGARYPANANGQAIVPLQGISLRPALTGGQLRRPTPIFWEHEGNRAVRVERWKLVARYGRPWELYDMAKDRSETLDVSATHPAIVSDLAKQWDAWAARSDVDPWLESYDIYIAGKERQLWGTADTPKIPQAIIRGGD